MTLAESFNRGNPRKTRFDGQTVHSYVRLPVADGTRITVTRVRSSLVRAQALKLAVDKGELKANGVVVPSVAVWSHTAPESVEIEVLGRKVRTLDIWNAWSLDGVDSSWLGNAGMLVDTSAGATLLSCSDGLGEPCFEDLVVRLEIANAE